MARTSWSHFEVDWKTQENEDGSKTIVEKFEETLDQREGDYSRALQNCPLWVLSRIEPDGNHRMWIFPDIDSLVVFMWGKDYRNYTLFVGKKIYAWPTDAGDTELLEHLKQCIDIEASFFDNPMCLDWLKRMREQEDASKRRRQILY